MLADEGMVGKVMLYGEIIFAEEKENLFPIFLIGTTIQDSGTRKRRVCYPLTLSPKIKKK